MVADSNKMRSNLPLQMFLYFNWWYTVLYFVITLAIFIYKGAYCLASRVRSLTKAQEHARRRPARRLPLRRPCWVSLSPPRLPAAQRSAPNDDGQPVGLRRTRACELVAHVLRLLPSVTMSGARGISPPATTKRRGCVARRRPRRGASRTHRRAMVQTQPRPDARAGTIDRCLVERARGQHTYPNGPPTYH